MNKTKAMYAIYKYDFHKAPAKTIQADGIEGERYVKNAQSCFESLFDQNSIDNLAKVDRKGDATRLPNDVMAKADGIYVWRVNNSQMKEWWARQGKDSQGIDKYEMQEIESNPYCNVLIDNRPGRCLMAIEKSAAWNSDPDRLRDILLLNFNRTLADRFDLEMRIEARMNPTDVWTFVKERIYDHGDYVKEVKFIFQNPRKINRTNAMEIKSARIKAMVETTQRSKALRGYYGMLFDQGSGEEFSQENEDVSEMVSLCAENGYDIHIKFKDFKTYRINDYVKAYYPMAPEVLEQFRAGVVMLSGKKELEEWFDLVEEQTKCYKNETEIKQRRNKKR